MLLMAFQSIRLELWFDVTAEILTSSSSSKDTAGLSIIHGTGNLLRFSR